MALSPRLDLRQAQTLVMTPQLQQAIKLLQLSQMDLAAYVEQELVENPLLERADDDSRADEPADSGENFEAVNAGEGDSEPEPADTTELTTRETLPEDAPLDTEFENVWTNGDAESPAETATPGGGDSSFESWGGGGRRDFGDADYGVENTLSEGVTLRQHLLDQLNVDIEEPADRLIGQLLIENVDEAGYMTTPLDELAAQLDCPIARVEQVLKRLQAFDPTGVCARSVTECFALQLAERDRLDPAMQALIDNLELLASHKLPILMKICGVDAQDLADMIGELKALNARPGATFEESVSQWITPDVLMRAKSDGGWTIELNTEVLPRVLVNNTYYAEIRQQARGKGEIEYLSERLQAANWLVKSLDQRATTILKVAAEIVRQQDEFFRRGITYLRPLVLRDIAEAIDMHESTVSRVTNNKYIATPRGIFEMKYFFTTSIASAEGGNAHSSEAVRHRIKALVDAESPKKILSDDKIVEILRADGVDIARRTVAKYRDALHIPSSVQRRRQKAVESR